MSTFLQLCAKLRQKTLDVGSGPTTTVSQSGQLGKLVLGIADAWTDIQQAREDWLWMRKSFTVNTVASDGAYVYGDCTDTVSSAAISRFARWYRNEFKAYKSSDGVGSEYPLIWMEWEQFRRIYRYGTQTDGQPVHVSVDPTQAFVLGPKPDAVYVVSGDYQIGPQDLTSGADPDANIPEMPTRFHNLIVYKAMVKFGLNSAAPEAIQEAQIEGGPLYFQLERDQLPPLTFGGPLA